MNKLSMWPTVPRPEPVPVAAAPVERINKPDWIPAGEWSVSEKGGYLIAGVALPMSLDCVKLRARDEWVCAAINAYLSAESTP